MMWTKVVVVKMVQIGCFPDIFGDREDRWAINYEMIQA